MTSKSSSSVPYPPDIHKEESNIRILSKPFKPNHILIHTHTHIYMYCMFVLYAITMYCMYVLYACMKVNVTHAVPGRAMKASA